MAEDHLDVVTVYLTTQGLPVQRMTQLARQLVKDKLAATADIYQRSHADGGAEVLAILHTRRSHLAAITHCAFGIEKVITAPLECDSRYRAWVLDSTAAA